MSLVEIVWNGSLPERWLQTVLLKSMKPTFLLKVLKENVLVVATAR